MDFTADVTGYFLNKVQQGGEIRNQENNRQTGALQSAYVFHSIIMQIT